MAILASTAHVHAYLPPLSPQSEGGAVCGGGGVGANPLGWAMLLSLGMGEAIASWLSRLMLSRLLCLIMSDFLCSLPLLSCYLC